MNKKHLKLSIFEVQKIVSDMLFETIKICNKHNIPYYCQAGTVLGAIRHSGPIPWDHDADIIVPNNEINRFVEIVNKELPKQYYVDYYTTNKRNLRQFPRIGMTGYSTRYLHLDVFRLIGIPNNKSEQLEVIKKAKYYTKCNHFMRRPIWKLILLGKFNMIITRAFNREQYLKLFNSLCEETPYEDAVYVMNPSGKYGEKNIFKKSIYGLGKEVNYNNFRVIIPKEYDFYLKQYYGNYMKYPSEEERKIALEKIYLVK